MVEDAQRLLAEGGWTVGHPKIVLSLPDAMAALMTSDVVAVVAAQGPERKWRLTPPPGGLVAVILDGDGEKHSFRRHLVPIDQTIPPVPSVTAAFLHRQTLADPPDQSERPAQRCGQSNRNGSARQVAGTASPSPQVE